MIKTFFRKFEWVIDGNPISWDVDKLEKIPDVEDDHEIHVKRTGILTVGYIQKTGATREEGWSFVGQWVADCHCVRGQMFVKGLRKAAFLAWSGPNLDDGRPTMCFFLREYIGTKRDEKYEHYCRINTNDFLPVDEFGLKYNINKVSTNPKRREIYLNYFYKIPYEFSKFFRRQFLRISYRAQHSPSIAVPKRFSKRKHHQNIAYWRIL
jgi:hypothetical protein